MPGNWWDAAPVIGGTAAPGAPAPAAVAAPATGSAPAGDAQWWANAPLVGGAPATSAPAAPQPGVVDASVAGLGQGIRNVIDKPAELLAGVFSKSEAERVQRMNAENKAANEQAYGGSTAYGAGKVGGEILTTLPVGGALGAGVRAAGAVGGVAPSVLVPLGEAIASGGMAARGAGLATRALGGAVNGGVTAGLVNPNDATTGAAIGAGLPLAARALGQVGGVIGSAFRGREVAPGVLLAAEDAQRAGFTLPPSQVNPTLVNQALEGLGGKIKTAQQASLRNQEGVNTLVRGELGLNAGEQITPDVLRNIRQTAGVAYDAVGNTGLITPSAAYDRALDNITAPYRRAAAGFPGAAPNPVIAQIDSLRSPAFDARSAIDKIRELRDMADAAYRRGEKDMGRAFKGGASALENAIEQHLATNGFPVSMLDDFRNARQTIARTYSVEQALNGTTGDVSGRKLAAQLAKGKPLSGGLSTAARAAQAFPKAFQDPAVIGSVTHFSPLDVAATVMAGAAGAGAASLGVPLARTAARSAALSGPIQRSLAQAPQPSSLASLALSPQASSLIGRAAPVALTGPSP